MQGGSPLPPRKIEGIIGVWFAFRLYVAKIEKWATVRNLALSHIVGSLNCTGQLLPKSPLIIRLAIYAY